MTAPVAADYQALILLEVGDTSGGPVGTRITTIWEMYADKASIAPRLQYMYSKLQAITIMMGQLRQVVSWETDQMKFANGEQQKTLAELYNVTRREINKIEEDSRKTRAPAVGDITIVEPLNEDSDSSTTGQANANHRRYRGDPYFPPLIGNQGN